MHNMLKIQLQSYFAFLLSLIDFIVMGYEHVVSIWMNRVIIPLRLRTSFSSNYNIDQGDWG